MAYNNIKGIIVEIGGDTTGLQKALKSVYTQTNSLQRELKDVNKLLKLDPHNTTMLSQKQKILKEDIAQTKEKLDALKTAQKDFEFIGGDLNSKKYRDLQREIVQTENDLKRLKLEASNWNAASKKLEEISQKFKKIGANITKVGQGLTTTVTLPIIGIGVAASKSAIEFESAFTGVEKTVDGTTEQMTALKDGIRQMAKEIPASTTEIAGVAEAAGQLGIKTDDILSFTRVMIDLGNSTNLSATEAASALAKFANVTKMSSKDYDRLGSTIVALGNNFATTEKDIVEMSTRLAATGELAGLSEPQILALATAMSSVGIEAEAGGSAMSKLLKKIQVSVETGDKSLTKFAKVAGVSVEEFKKAYGEDAVKAMGMFISGLNDTERNGKSAIAILDDMGLNEVRLSNTILSLANGEEVLNGALELGQKAWEENNALTNEASKRYQTFESKLKTTQNKLKDVGITIGNIILPYIDKFLDKVEDLIKKFENLSPEMQENIVKFAALAAAIGPVLIVVGKLFTAMGTIFHVGSQIAGLIANLTAGTGGISAALTALTGPVGIIIAICTALVGIFINLWQNSENFRNSIIAIGENIATTFNEHIKPALDDLIAIVTMLWNDVLMPFIGWIMTTFGPLFEQIFINLGKLVSTVFQSIGEVVHGITGVFRGLIDFIAGVFTGDWERAWKGVQEIFGGIFNGLKGLVVTPLNWIIDRINDFIWGVNQIKIPDGIPGVGGVGFNFGYLNKIALAKGGIVTGPTNALIGEGRSAEAVIPLDRTLSKYMAEAMKQAGGVGGITVNFYPQKMTDAELDNAFNYINRKFGLAY